MQNHLKFSCALIVSFAVARHSFAVVGASPNTGQPGATTFHNISGGGGGGSFQITEDVVLDITAGAWTKNLVNSTGGGISSGADRTIIENLTNVGAAPWLDWHESIVSRTTIFQPDDAPGFLFRENSLLVMADYGSGLVALSPGVDYTLTTAAYSGPPDPGNNQHWEAIDIVFAPGRIIESGDVLHIEKSIFEIFGDANPWRPSEAALVSEFPSPEPASVFTSAAGIAMILLRRMRRH